MRPGQRDTTGDDASRYVVSGLLCDGLRWLASVWAARAWVARLGWAFGSRV